MAHTLSPLCFWTSDYLILYILLKCDFTLKPVFPIIIFNMAARKQQANDLAEARLRERVKSFISDVIKGPEEIIVRSNDLPIIVLRGIIATLEGKVHRVPKEVGPWLQKTGPVAPH